MIKIKNGKLIINISDKDKKLLFYIFLFIAFILSILATRKLMYDPDSFWHIKTGEWIFKNRQVPTHDTFSWYGKENGFTWLNHEWLFDLLMYLVYRLGGFNLVMWFVAALGGILFLLITWFCYLRSNNIGISLIISLISMIGMQPYLQPRPQTASFCLLLIFCILLEKKKWYWTIPIVILGANLHGGFYPMYLVVAAYYCYKEKPLIIMLSALAVLVNPYTYHMYLYTINNRASDIGSKYILEAFKTPMASGDNMIVLASYFIIICLIHKVKVPWQDALMSFAVVTLTFMAQRHVVFAYLLVIPILSPYIKEGIENLLSALSNKVKIKIKSNFANFAVVEILFLILITFANSNTHNLNPNNLVPEKLFPAQAVNYIKSNNIDRLFNDYGIGGYLIFNDIPTLVDGRADPFSENFNNTTILRDYMKAINLESDFTEFLSENKIENILIPKKSRLYNSIHSNPTFKKVYEDKYFIIYKRGVI